MTKSSLKVSIKTPTKIIHNGSVDKLGVISKDGNLTIYPNHANLATLLDVGFVSLYDNNDVNDIFCFGGLMEVDNGDVVILTEDAKVASEELLLEIEEAINVAQNKKKEISKYTMISLENLLKAEIELRYKLDKKKIV